MRLIINILKISIVIFTTLYSQSITPPEFVITDNQSNEKLSFLLNETSEVKLTALWTIRIYQNYISSQHDHRMCNFIPSCSRFGVDAIKNTGIGKGILLTSDRLQRCNNLDNWKYVMDESENKMIDPISSYINVK
tara:strand:+ start:500 stop:904 length:405 start_codon:yes stop_codon:yes gene_type:complete